MSAETEREGLLKLRSKLAFEANSKNSWSFGNKELEALLIARPKTLEELVKIKGFPADGKRVAAYGKNIIDVFTGKSIDNFDVKVTGDSLEVKTLLRRSNSFK